MQVMEQKLFESGHSQNEGDSMRSCIQHEFEKRDIYLLSEYHDGMRSVIKDL